MVNILIIEDNLNYSKNLINILFEKRENARLYKILTNGSEAIKILKTSQDKIDVIILDLNLPGINGINILKEIENTNLVEYKGSIIVISGEIELISQIIGNGYIYSYINKLSGFEKISYELSKLIEIKEQEKASLEHKIFKELKYLNYNFSYLGTKYLEKAIKLIYEYDNIDCIKLEKDIYLKLSKKYNKSTISIKTDIIHATDLMYYDCNSEKLSKYFGIVNNEKPTPKMVITTIVKKLKYEI